MRFSRQEASARQASVQTSRRETAGKKIAERQSRQPTTASSGVEQRSDCRQSPDARPAHRSEQAAFARSIASAAGLDVAIARMLQHQHALYCVCGCAAAHIRMRP
jgi:hypothetical protein